MPEFDDRDTEIAIARVERREAISGPRIGDYLDMPHGDVRRFAHHWGDRIQPNDPRFGGEGSFYLGANGGADYSGSLEDAILLPLLRDTGRVRDGRFWFFHHDFATAHNGVTVAVPCRVYELAEPAATGLDPEALRQRLFTGIYSTGIVYADRGGNDSGGDYKRLAFLAFDTLRLDVKTDCPPDLRRLIADDAAAIQVRRGEQYQISTSGQTVILGSGIKTTSPPLTEPTDQGEQIVLPGTAKSAVQLAAAREAAGHGRKRSKRPQRDPGGLFDPPRKAAPGLFD